MALASEALDSARVYLNDVGQGIWSNSKLLPYLKEAYKDMMVNLWLNGIPIMREKNATYITVTAGSLILGLPTDFIEPIRLKERPTGTSQTPVDMYEKAFEPDTPQTTELRYWAFREGQIQFVGATTDRDVLLFYWKSLTIPTAANSPLGFVFAEIFLGPQTAGYAAGSIGNRSLADELLFINEAHPGIAGAKLDVILRANIRGQQSLPTRRVPYRRARRARVFTL